VTCRNVRGVWCASAVAGRVALAEVAELGGGKDVFRLQPLGALGVLADFQAATAQIDLTRLAAAP